MVAQSPLVGSPPGPSAQAVGGGRRSQPDQYRFQASSGVSLTSTSIMSEHSSPTPPGQEAPLNGSRVAATKLVPELLWFGSGGLTWVPEASPGRRQVGHS